MDSEMQILLRRARTLPEEERRELVRQILLSLESGVHELRESIRPYDSAGIPAADAPHKPWSSLADLRSQLGVTPLALNPVIEMREEERF